MSGGKIRPQSPADKATRNERIFNAVWNHQYKLKEVGDHLGLSTIRQSAWLPNEWTRATNPKNPDVPPQMLRIKL